MFLSSERACPTTLNRFPRFWWHIHWFRSSFCCSSQALSFETLHMTKYDKTCGFICFSHSRCNCLWPKKCISVLSFGSVQLLCSKCSASPALRYVCGFRVQWCKTLESQRMHNMEEQTNAELIGEDFETVEQGWLTLVDLRTSRLGRGFGWFRHSHSMRLRGFGEIPFIDGLPGSAGHRWPQEESRHSTRQLRLGYDATRSEKLLKLSMRIFASKKTTLPISYVYIYTYIYMYTHTLIWTVSLLHLQIARSLYGWWRHTNVLNLSNDLKCLS